MFKKLKDNGISVVLLRRVPWTPSADSYPERFAESVRALAALSQTAYATLTTFNSELPLEGDCVPNKAGCANERYYLENFDVAKRNACYVYDKEVVCTGADIMTLSGDLGEVKFVL